MKHLKLQLLTLLTVLIGLATMTGGCTTDIENGIGNNNGSSIINPDDSNSQIHRLIVDIEEFVLGPAETTVTANVTADCEWTICCADDWCSVSPESAPEGKTAIAISVRANDSGETRTTTLTFNTEAQIKKSITITQRSYQDVTAMQTLFEADHNGGTFSTQVISDLDWEIVGAPSWITLQPVSGEQGETTLTIEVAPNNSTKGRSAEMYFRGDFDNADTLRVVQTGNTVFSTNAPEFHESPMEGDVLTVGILSNIDYTVESSELWIRLSATQGHGDGVTADSLQIQVGKNFTAERDGFVTITAPEIDSTIIIPIHQDGTGFATGNLITSFRFTRSANPSLSRDIDMTIEGDSIVGYISDLNVDITSLKASFTCSSRATVYVGQLRQTSGSHAQDYSKRLQLTVVAENGAERIYTVAARHFTGLPILYINTNSGKDIASQTSWEGATYKLDGGLNYESIGTTQLQVKGCDDPSWNTSHPKPSYDMQLRTATEVCGMPAHKNWCLISNHSDKTLMRNQVAMALGRATGLEWVPRGVQVELIQNGTHRGTYLLSEQIQADNNRVNIGGSNGYILKLDNNTNNSYHSFSSKYITGSTNSAKGLVQVYSPTVSAGNSQQFTTIEADFRAAEEAICNNGGDWSAALNTYLDLNSIIDQWLIYEITATPEPARGPYNYYMYKKSGDSKFYGGPLWDFDYKSFIPGTQNTWVNNNAAWIPFLWNCPEFRGTAKAHWDMYKADFYDIQSRYINTLEQLLSKSADANWAIYNQNLGTNNGDENLSSTAAIQRLREVLKARLDWLEVQFQDWGNANGNATIAPLPGDTDDKNKEDFWN